jgi:hypothetical protein
MATLSEAATEVIRERRWGTARVTVAVDYFSDDLGHLVPPEVRVEIEEEAYEAAREAILVGLDRHLRRFVPVLDALRGLT